MRAAERTRVVVPMGKLFDREPPFSAEAELALLGAMVLDPNVIPEIVGVVRGADDFYIAEHGSIYTAIVGVYEATSGGDLVQIQDRLRAMGVYDQIGGEEKLHEIAEAVPVAVNAPYYARIVADKAQLRRIIEACGKGLYAAYHPGLEAGAVREVADTVEAAIFAATEARSGAEATDMATLMQRTIEEQERQDAPVGVPTGFHALDVMLSGLQPGEMTILAARPSMGKTALALNIAEQVARSGIPTVLFSLEMSEEAVAHRLISACSGIPSQALRARNVQNMRGLVEACGSLTELPLTVVDKPALTIMEMRGIARRLHRARGTGLLVIDYLQLLTAPHVSRESRQVEVSAISRGIKALARELDVPIVCLAQLNRQSEQREGNRPRMADLRESGSIEQDADNVLLLHREEYYHLQDKDWALDNDQKVGVAEVIVAKQRNGPTGVVELRWSAERTRFMNMGDRL